MSNKQNVSIQDDVYLLATIWDRLSKNARDTIVKAFVGEKSSEELEVLMDSVESE